MMQKIIYSDMDGTILNHYNYSYKESKKGLSILKEKNIPLILCTSKTKAEILYWKEKLAINHPFISENGGGIFIPKNYFSFNFKYDKIIDKYYCIIFGADINNMKKFLYQLKKEFKLKSFIDMSEKEISKISNFNIDDAKRAKMRDFEIPFILKEKKDEKKILEKIKESGYNYMVGGRYYHILGKNSKGLAIKKLNKLFKRKYGEIFTIGIGDSFNDFSMLDSVDKGFLVKNKDNKYVSEKYLKAGDTGPKGWNKIILKEFG